MSLSICAREAADDHYKGSIGYWYLLRAIRQAGYDVTEEPTSGGYDVELVSIHGVRDLLRLKLMPRLGDVRIVGGFPLSINPRPAIPYADYICVGEGEEWIVRALKYIESGESLESLPGTIVCDGWTHGSPIPEPTIVESVPDHPPYLNVSRNAGHADNWYIELSRGCKFSCHYCGLGWSKPFRARPVEDVMKALDSVDKARSKRVTLFAPDEASHHGYPEILRAVHQKGLRTSFGSMRLDTVMASKLPVKKNFLIRIGIDGLTEETRRRVRKPITNQQIYEYFKFMTDRGHVAFKLFMIWGYPWEKTSDFDEWETLMDRVFAIPRDATAHLRMKFTPLVPQPNTPLRDAKPNYTLGMKMRILRWFERRELYFKSPGWWLVNDGIPSARSHALDCALSNGDENCLTKLHLPGDRRRA